MKRDLWFGVSLIVFLSIIGCGASKQPPDNLTGAVLGWNNKLYKIASSTNIRNVGKKLGTETFHGKVSGEFSVYERIGSNPAEDIVFESSDGQYYTAVITNSTQ